MTPPVARRRRDGIPPRYITIGTHFIVATARRGYKPKHKAMQNNRMDAVEEAIIPLINRRIAETPGTISLGQGVVFYPPPPQAIAYATEQMSRRGNQHLYGPVEGLPELREAFADKLDTDNNIKPDERQMIFVTAGANMAFNALMLACCAPGDEVILLLPYYFNHEMTAVMCGCKARCARTDDGFQPMLENIKNAIGPKTRAVVTVSPNNPSGCVYSEQTLTAINALCAEHNIYHISDEAYEDFAYETPHFSPASIAGAGAHTLSLFSMSKSYGFASWRIGYMVVPKQLGKALTKVQDNILICPPAISQYAAIACLRDGRPYLAEQLRVIKANRELCLEKLAPLAEQGIISAPPAAGAMYLFVRLNTDTPDKQIACRLIDERRVAVLPGSAFGDTGQPALRISYGALTADKLEQGIDRLVKGLQDLA